MFKRPFFLLGLLCGSIVAFCSLFKRPLTVPVQSSKLLSCLIDYSLVVCDSTGKITEANAAAMKLFGPLGIGITGLRYPTGQNVPPGQLPLTRALRTRSLVVGAGYQIRDSGDSLRILDVRAQPLPLGGAVAVFSDVTVMHECEARESQSQARQQAVQQLCSRLSKAATAEEIGRAAVDSIRTLVKNGDDVQVHLYAYDPMAQTLTRLASDPEARSKLSQFAMAAMSTIFRFDATDPALWQLYIDRQPSSLVSRLAMPAEAEVASSYALPLLNGGAATGHLSMTSSADGAFTEASLLETLTIIASLTALALTGPQSLSVADALKGQSDAIHKVAQAISRGFDLNRLADLTASLIRRTLGGQVCTVSVMLGNRLTVAGEAFQDDLLFPERVKADDTALHGKVVQKAWKTQKIVSQSGIKNPSFEAGSWRAFAGKSGMHSIFAFPLTSGQGVLTVYTDGAVSLPENQVKFLETVASLLSMAVQPATSPKAETNE